MDDKKIARINELSAAARERELTEDEQSERAQLRAEYVAAYKKSIVNHLNNVKIVDDKGNKTPLRKKAKKMKCNNYNNMKHLFYPLNRSRLFFNVKDSSANLFC